MIVLLGGTGFIGGAISRYLDQQEIDYLSISRSQVNYTDRDCLIEFIREVKPDFLINAAGFTGKPNVDECEIQKWASLQGNAVLPGVIRDACEMNEIPWGHVSSGCIYTGCRPDGLGFSEEDTPNFSFRTDNCSFYSGTKALGEEVLADAENAFIWRVRIPFNHVDSSRNYLSKLIRYQRLLEATNSITQLDEFARICVECWQRRVEPGIYNVTNTGSVTTSRVTELIRQELDETLEFEFFESEGQFMSVAAKAPRSNCVLDNSKIRETGIPISHVEDAIVRSLQEWVWERSSQSV